MKTKALLAALLLAGMLYGATEKIKIPNQYKVFRLTPAQIAISCNAGETPKVSASGPLVFVACNQ